MTDLDNIQFIDNPAVQNSDGAYLDIQINVAKALESWRLSLFSFEWLTPEGKIKTTEALSENERPKRRTTESHIKNGTALEKPILGIGLKDNIEIGAGRAIFLTLAAHGMKTMPVHIPKSNESDFKPFRADVNS